MSISVVDVCSRQGRCGYDGTAFFVYNYFRDFDPSIGRYVQSDPIGLRGGINTYAYVGSSPLRNIDPLGLQVTGPPDPNKNTVVCDGNDSMEPQVLPIDPVSAACGLGDCIRVHENVHIFDMMQINKNVCKGKPKGVLVLFPADVHAATEIKASEAEIACLKGKLKDCDKCSPIIKARIQQMEKYRDSFK